MKKDELKLVKIDSKYCDYLRKFDNRVPYNFNKKELRPFVGVLFFVEEKMYFAPLSSPKPKHLNMPNKIDFLKLDEGKLGAINFNNMIPVLDNNISVINFSSKSFCEENTKYSILLRKQYRWLNRHDNGIYNKSKTLYQKYLKGLLPKQVEKRCCNFKLLEEKCLEYNERYVEIG